jgi:glycyl-tRNA synthetase alpha chain
VDSIYDIVWAHDPETRRVTTYADVRLADELQFSVYNFEVADVDKAWKHFELFERECLDLIERRPKAQLLRQRVDQMNEQALGTGVGTQEVASQQNAKSYPLLAAYDLCLKCSHLFNILDARGAISVTERVGVIARVRALAVGIARAWVDQQKGEAAAEKSDDPGPVREKKTKKEKLLPAAI